MPHDRRTGRVLLAMMALVGVAVSAGCMRSTNLRTSAGSLPELSPAGELHPVSGEATPGTSSPKPTGATTSWTRGPTTTPPRSALDPEPRPSPPAVATTPGGPAPSGAPGGSEPVEASSPGGQPSAAPAPAGDPPRQPTPSPTPLLDAEIRRAEAVTRQHIESLKAAVAPTPIGDPPATSTSRPVPAPEPAPVPIVEPRPAELKPGDTDPDDLAPLPLTASVLTEDRAENAGSTGGIVVPPLIPIDTTASGSAPAVTMTSSVDLPRESPGPQPDRAATSARAREADRRVEEANPPRSEPGGPDPLTVADRQADEVRPASGLPPAQAGREERPALEIAALRLCSRVRAFGAFEPSNPDGVKPGQRVLVYCEMAGLEYQARGDAFVSRLSAHLELRSGADGSVVWEQAPGTAEDLCHRPRRDYFVSYLVEWPRSLEPGTYRLRLIQTDLVGNRAASREIPVTIVR